MHFCDVIAAKTEARQPLALLGQHSADVVFAAAIRRHQFDRHVVEREQRARRAAAGVAPGWRAAEQRLVGARAGFDV